jgi:hypothetical protein
VRFGIWCSRNALGLKGDCMFKIFIMLINTHIRIILLRETYKFAKKPGARREILNDLCINK